MAVIITDMDMRKACLDEEELICPLYDRCRRKGISVGYSLPNNCPLKSTDEMIAEIHDKDLDLRYCGHNLMVVDCIDIIHKYCDKEQNNET